MTEPIYRQRLLNLERCLKLELRAHRLPMNQRILAEVFLELTFGWGLGSIIIANHGLLVDLTGIDDTHVIEALDGLESARIIARAQVDRGIRYRVRWGIVDGNKLDWKAPPRTNRERMRQARETIKQSNPSCIALPGEVELEMPEDLHVAPSDGVSGGLTFKTPPDEVANPGTFFSPIGITDSVAIPPFQNQPNNQPAKDTHAERSNPPR